MKQNEISARDRQFLRDSQCGYLDRIPYVCCSHEERSATVTSTTTRRSTTQKSTTTTTTEATDRRPKWLVSLEPLLPKPPQCGQDATNKIFGGEETELGQYPWMVLVEFKKRKSLTKIFGSSETENFPLYFVAENQIGFHCGGSLINERYVLTGEKFSNHA